MSVEVAEPQRSFQATLCAEKCRSTVKLTENLLFVSLLNERTGAASNYRTFNVHDLIGCRSYRLKPDATGVEKRKVVFAVFARNARRVREYREIAVVFDGVNSEANVSDAERFVEQVYSKLRHFTEPNDLGLHTRFDFGSGKRLLFLVNPRSGKRQALKLFCEFVAPALRNAGMRDYRDKGVIRTVSSAMEEMRAGQVRTCEDDSPCFEVLVTAKANEAWQFAQSVDLAPFYGVVTVSGDGLLYEVLNGLMRRRDWQQAIRTPVGVLPGGTGNCLAANVAFAGDEVTDNLLLTCVYLLLHHNVQPFDLFACELQPSVADNHASPQGDRLYSFLGFMWGLLSDIDIESESLRAFGKLRYPIYALQRILAPRFRTIRGRLTYLPVSSLSEAELRNPGRELDPDGCLRFRFLPPVNQPIATDSERKWCVLEGEFVTVTVNRLSHLVDDSLVAPEMNRSDLGFGNLFVAKAGYSRLAILRQLAMFVGGNTEGIAQSESVLKVPIVALRVQPFDQRGIFTFDGEVVPFGTVQMEIIPGLARLLAVHEHPLPVHVS